MIITPEQKRSFLHLAFEAALAAGHPFPAYAACEAAEESAFGTSALARQTNNLFGEKQPRNHELPYPKIKMMTHEWDAAKQEMVPAPAYWPVFPDYKTAFAERLALLRRLATAEPGYAAGLRIADQHLANPQPADGAAFVKEISRNWSTDPKRADKVLGVYAQFQGVFPNA